MRPTPSVVLTVALLAAGALAGSLPAADGDLDTSFQDGAFTLGWGADHARATALEPLADGELLVGGSVADSPGDVDGWAVAKLEADGTRELDWTFNFQPVSAGDETMATNGELYDMRRDASGRTYLAGMADAGIDYEVPMLARLQPNGALDASFDDNGILVVQDMPEDWDDIDTAAAVILADGRSVFAGSCQICPVEGERRVWVTRRLANGGPDLSFSDDGWISFKLIHTAERSRASALAVDESGRIVVGGEVGAVDAETCFSRLSTSGAMDNSFGGGDGTAGPFAEIDTPMALAIDPSTGRITSATGNTGAPGSGAVDVFTEAGVPDATFSGDGHVDLDLEEGTSIHGLAFQSDGKLLAVGTINSNGTNTGGFFLARMTTAGGLDSTFDGNGVKRVEFDAAPDARDRAFAVATMGGRFVAVGFADDGGGQEEEMAVVRTQNAQIFSDGFERGSTGAWPGL